MLDALLGAAQLGGVEGVAFDQAELAADDLVQGADVARDVDALDEHARPFADLEDDPDGLVFAVAVDARPDVDERIAEGADGLDQRVDGLVDLVGIVPFAHLQLDHLLEALGLEVAQPRLHPDLAETVACAFFHGEREEEVLAVRGQLGHCGNDTEIGVTVLQVETPQQFAVQGQAVRVVGIVNRKEAIPAGFPGADDLAQA